MKAAARYGADLRSYADATIACLLEPPNKRLKLAGALVLEEAVESCPGGHGTFVHTLAPVGESPAA